MIVATPGANVGSVGVYAMHVDESKSMEDKGMKVTLVSAGKYKTEYAPTGAMTEEALAYLQSQVDVSYDKFCQALRRNRGTTIDNVRNGYGQGRVLNVDDALTAGMIDRVMPFDQLMARLVGKQPDGVVRDTMRQGVSADVLRLRNEHRQRVSGVEK
jgi:ClpP class serine protease